MNSSNLRKVVRNNLGSVVSKLNEYLCGENNRLRFCSRRNKNEEKTCGPTELNS